MNKFSELVDDDITDDIDCAQIIYDKQGFSAWSVYKSKCKDADKSHSIDDCKL